MSDPTPGRKKMRTSIRIAALAAISLVATLMMVAQTGTTVTALLARARAQEQSGRVDLAAQTWQQVLLVDAKDREALAGAARAAKLAGDDAEARKYLDRLQQVDPNNPEIARVQSTASSKAQITQLQKAAQLAQTGHADEALRVYRSVWGERPPDGDWALAYYDTEASIETQRADAIIGLRALAKKYPADARYIVTLGRILTYNPKTRGEGLQLLQRFSQNSSAQDAIRQAHLWDAANPVASPGIREYLKQHPDDQITHALEQAESGQKAKPKADTGIARGEAESEAFAALASGRVDDAERRFSALQLDQPDNPRVAAGLGFLRMKEGKFSAAIKLFEQAQKSGLRRRDIDEALNTARFWAAVQRGTDALNSDKMDEAIASYKSALLLRPASIDALNGLNGAYRKAGEHTQAVAVSQQLVKLQPQSADAWRDLFDVQVQAGQPAAALETAKHLPANIQFALHQRPAFLRSLAAAYTANGQASEARAILEEALALPFPTDAGSLKLEARLQHAGLLADAKLYAQAAGAYRDLLYDDPENLQAWQGLVAMQHQAGHDADAIATAQRMAPSIYDAALEDDDFLALLASIYQQQNRFELAQQLLQRAAGIYLRKGEAVPVALQIQSASIALQQNHPEQAYEMFRTVLTNNPNRAEAWKGLISALHQTNREKDALAQLRVVPLAVRRELDRDSDYQQAVAGIYAATGNPSAALQLIAQIQAHYRSMHEVAPAAVEIQNAWLLYSTHDDHDLYRELMVLGGRADLRDDERRTVQTIWATWSVRRAGEAVDAGNLKRSLEILTVAYQAFPDNPDVSKALAGGYLKAGDPKRSMDIFTALHLANPSAPDYQIMVSAALAVPNLRQAEAWLREALEKFGNDPKVLALAARFEQVRGDHTRAAAYWKASLAAMPPADPANRLAHALDRADVGPVRQAHRATLQGLLDPDSETAAKPSRPALPSYGETYSRITPVRSDTAAEALYGVDPYLEGHAPVSVEGTQVPAESGNSAAAIGSVRGGSSALSDPFAPPEFSGMTKILAPATDPPAAAIRASGSADDRDAVQESQPNANRRIMKRGPLPQALNLTPQSSRKRSPGSDAVITNSALHYPDSTTTRQGDLTTEPGGTIYLQPQADAPTSETEVAHRGSVAQSLAIADVTYIEPEPAQQAGVTDAQLQQQELPPLRGPWGPQVIVRETDPRTETENQLAVIDAGYSPWKGGTGYISHRTGTAGFDQLEILEAPFEASATLGGSARLTAIVTPSLLDSGVADGSSTDQLGTLAAGARPAQQNSTGVGGEVQLTTANFGVSAGTTPRGFLVPNITGRVSVHPTSAPLTLNFVREGMRDSQLSYAGLRDPGSVSSTYAGNIWGGVISNAGNVQYSRGDEVSGYYAGLGGQYITGLNVETNDRIDGVAGAYWKVLKIPETAEVTLGANFFGMHYAHNLRYFTYGQGGYFSPSAYFLANLPFTVKGQYGSSLHYTVAGALGLQAFQEDSSLYYPTHVYAAAVPVTPAPALGLHPVFPVIPILPTPAPFSNPSYPSQSVVGGNYDLRAEVSDHIVDRWYIGGFISFNNTRDYANQTIGFFIRYMSRPQDLTEDAPTGIFPYQGLRPLLVP